MFSMLYIMQVIPLNPTGWYGRPSDRGSVNRFCQVLQDEFRIACTPRVRRGIDIDAGCGQLTTKIEKDREKADKVQADEREQSAPFSNGEDVEEDEDVEEEDLMNGMFAVDPNAVDLESAEDYDDPEYNTDFEMQEAVRLIALVQQGAPIAASTPVMTKMEKTSNKPSKSNKMTRRQDDHFEMR
jgi:hypothetical protein